jgi:hypothetical protein
MLDSLDKAIMSYFMSLAYGLLSYYHCYDTSHKVRRLVDISSQHACYPQDFPQAHHSWHQIQFLAYFLLSLPLPHLRGQGSLFFESRKYANKNRRFYFYFQSKFMIDVQYFFNPSILREKIINI